VDIVQINTTDCSGGAARAAYALHRGLRRLGHQSLMFVKTRISMDDSVKLFNPSMDFPGRLRRYMRRKRIAYSIRRYKHSRPQGYKDFREDRSEYFKNPLNQIPPCDVINLHWIAEFIDYQILPQAAHRAPLVWTLHDMNAFTGGCHYDHDCGKFVDSCGACPQLGSNNEKDLSRKIWRRKKRIFERIPSDRLRIVTPSQWLAEETRRSSLLGDRPIDVIPNSLDTVEFAPRDKACSRKILGISQETKTVLFSAQSITNFRKGFHLLTQILNCLPDLSDALLISIGGGIPPSPPAKTYMPIGFVDNNRLLSLLYSAADVFVIPSLQDNLPNTVLESMACGTPAVGFAVGGIPDMIRHGETGILAPPYDIKAFCEGILELLHNNEKRAEMSLTCRQVIEKEYSMESQARNYCALYNKILNMSHEQSSTPLSR